MVPEHNDAFINAESRRRFGGLAIEYRAIDGAGVTYTTWGLVFEGDLPLDADALQREIERPLRRDERDDWLGSPEVYRFQSQGAGQEIIGFVIESTPEALYGAAVAAGLAYLGKQLKPWADPPGGHGDEKHRAPPQRSLRAHRLPRRRSHANPLATYRS